MKKLFAILLFIYSSNVFCQQTDNVTVTGSTSSMNASYSYKANVTFTVKIEGLLGDIKVYDKVNNYQLTSYNYKGIDASTVGYSYPISVNRFTNKAYVDINFYKGTSSYTAYNLDPETNFPAYLSDAAKDGLFRKFNIDPSERDCITCDALNKAKALEIKAKNVKLEDLGASNLILEINSAIDEKLSLDNRISNLIQKANSLPNDNKNSLLEKKSIYNQLAELDDDNNYSSEIEGIEEKMRILAKQEIENEEGSAKVIENVSLTVEKKETEKEREKDDFEKIKEEEKKKQTESEDQAVNYFKMRTLALDLVSKAKSTSVMAERVRLLKIAKSYSDYLSKAEIEYIQDEIRGTVTREVSKKLASIEYGYDDRRVLIMLNSGMNSLFGSYDGQFDAAIPLNLNTELTFPLGRKLALEIQGEYSYNYVLRLGDAGAILNASGGNVDPLPDSDNDFEENTKYGKYYYSLGINMGSARKFSFLIISQNIQYFHQEKENGIVNLEIGTEEFISTYGLGLAYNFLGKNKQELGRIMATYTVNDKNIEFINSDYAFNEISNINIKYEAGYGAFLFGLEYNNFKNKSNDVNLSTIGIKLGVKLGL